MSAAPTRNVLNGPANQVVCQSYRVQLLRALNADCFTGNERHRGMAAYQSCDDPKLLHDMLQKVLHVKGYRERKQAA